MTITRLDPGARLSQAVVHGGVVYLAGQVGGIGETAERQTEIILSQIDSLLARAGSDKNHLLSATILLADMANLPQMNAAWDAWIAGSSPPTRATAEARLANPGYKVEIIVVAAIA